MKQVNMGALVRMTVLAALLGSASYAQDLTDDPSDETTIEQTSGDDATVADDSDASAANVGSQDGSDGWSEDATTDDGTIDVVIDDGADIVIDDGVDIVIDDGAVIDPWPVDDSGLILIDPPIYVIDPLPVCDENAYCYGLPVEEEPVVVREYEDWVKREDEVVQDDGVDPDCGSEVCVTFNTGDEGVVIENPEILYSLAGGGAGPDIQGGDAPVVMEMASDAAGQMPTSVPQILGESSGATIERSASADGRVLCLSVPKVERNGRSAFDLCEP